MAAGGQDGWAGVMDGALSELVDRAGLDLAFGARVQPDGRRLVISRLHGARTPLLRDLVVLKGTGLGGKAMALGRPVTVNDYVGADGISHEYDLPVMREGIHAILAVPLLTGGRVSGVCYAALRQRLDIGERLQRVAASVARRAEERLAGDARAGRDVRERQDVQAGRDVPARQASAAAPADPRLRDAYDDLGSLLERVRDPGVRAELERIRHRMTGTGDDARPRTKAPEPPVPLSRREREALRCAALGLANAEIAELMGLSPGTVKCYLSSVMRKLGTRNRMEAVNTARGMGYPV